MARRIATILGAAATLTAVAVVIVFALPRSGPAQSPSSPTPTSAITPVSSTLASPSPVSSIGRGLNALAPGQSQELSCGDDGPQVDLTGSKVACAGALLSWPELVNIVSVAGSPLGWGRIDGTEWLLTMGGEGYALVGLDGTKHLVTIPGASGRTIALWSPDRSALWLQTGIQTSHLSLFAWTPSRARVIATIPAGAPALSNLTASPSQAWIAAWQSGCSASGDCVFTVSVGPVNGQQRALGGTTSGQVVAVAVDDGGRVAVVRSRNDGTVDLLAGSTAGPLTSLARGVRAWPLDDGSYAVSDGKTLSRLDPSSGAMRAIALPNGMVAASIASVSPDGNLVAVWSSSAQGNLDFGRVASSQALVETAATFTPKASVIWPADARFAIFADGPPIDHWVVRMAP